MSVLTVLILIPEDVPLSTVELTVWCCLGKCYFLCWLCKDKLIKASYAVTVFSMVQTLCNNVLHVNAGHFCLELES